MERMIQRDEENRGWVMMQELHAAMTEADKLRRDKGEEDWMTEVDWNCEGDECDDYDYSSDDE